MGGGGGKAEREGKIGHREGEKGPEPFTQGGVESEHASGKQRRVFAIGLEGRALSKQRNYVRAKKKA